MADNNLTPKEEFLLNPVEEHNIENVAVATFETNLKQGLKVTVPMAPIQDLHGMPNPYPAGASVNLIPDGTDTENGYVSGQHLNVDGTTKVNANWYISEYITLDAETTYTWSNRVNTNVAPSICFYDENKDFLSGININSQYSYTFIPPEGAVYCRSSQTTYAYQEASASNGAFQLEVGSTATAYRRYSNICPIEGYAASVLCNTSNSNLASGSSNFSFNPIQSGSGNPSPTNIRPITTNMSFRRDDGTKLDVFKGTLLLNIDGTSVLTKTYGSYVFSGNESFSWYGGGTDDKTPGANCWAYTTVIKNAKHSGDCNCNKYIPHNAGYNFSNSGNLGCAFGSQVSSHRFYIRDDSAYTMDLLHEHVVGLQVVYPLYTPVTYQLSIAETVRALDCLAIKSVPIAFTNPTTGDPMTVYGGTLTLNEDGSADVVATHGISVYDGNDNESYSSQYGSIVLSPLKANHAVIASNSNKPLKTNYLNQIAWIAPFAQYANMIAVSTSSSSKFNIKIKDVTVNNVREYLQENPLQIYYPLATSRTYHFPNVGQLKAFLGGQNNVWSDLGNVNVKYLTQHSETGVEWRRDRALELQRRVMIANRPMLHTAVGTSETGGLASFKSYMTAPVKSVTVPFYPKQDLHGMPNPYPAGASVNLIPDGTDTENGYVASTYLLVDGTYTTGVSNWYVSEYFEVNPETTYTWSNRGASEIPSICFYDSNKTFISGIAFNNQSHTFVPPENAVYARSSQTTYTYQVANPTGVAFQLEVGSTATEYHRYSNICPIEGWSGCDINKTTASGNIINLVSGNIINVSGGYTIRSGYQLYFAANTREAVVLFPVQPNTAYTYVAQKSSGGSSTMTVFEYSDKPTNKSEYQIRTITASFGMGTTLRRKTFTTSANAKYVGIDIHKGSGTGANTVSFSAYIGENTTDTFGNYAVDTIPIAFTDPSTGDPLTVYGGTVTINPDGSADVVSEYGIKTISQFKDYTVRADDPSAGWNLFQLYLESDEISESKGNSNGDSIPLLWATKFNRVSMNYRIQNPGYNMIKSNVYVYFNAPADLYPDKNAFLTAFGDVPVVYPLANTQAYHFNNVGQLKVWLGKNNFWCDISDDITVKYWNRG